MVEATINSARIPLRAFPKSSELDHLQKERISMESSLLLKINFS